MIPQALTAGAPDGRALAGATWSYAAAVFYPAQALKRAGAPIGPRIRGDAPEPIPGSGLGPRFSRRYKDPVLLGREGTPSPLVDEFDRGADVYDAYTQPFSRPIFDEALEEMRRYLRPDARVLDAGCGTGRELQRVAVAVPGGEVVGVDLAAGMVRFAHRAAYARGLDNCAFFQADVADLPPLFTGQFDLVYSSLAYHHYPTPAAATASVLRCLRPAGIYCVIDAGPAWYNAISAPFARWADPGWVGFHTPEEFRRLFLAAGFARASWTELLPGYGLATGQKALRAGRR